MLLKLTLYPISHVLNVLPEEVKVCILYELLRHATVDSEALEASITWRNSHTILMRTRNIAVDGVSNKASIPLGRHSYVEFEDQLRIRSADMLDVKP